MDETLTTYSINKTPSSQEESNRIVEKISFLDYPDGVVALFKKTPNNILFSITCPIKINIDSFLNTVTKIMGLTKPTTKKLSTTNKGYNWGKMLNKKMNQFEKITYPSLGNVKNITFPAHIPIMEVSGLQTFMKKKNIQGSYRFVFNGVIIVISTETNINEIAPME